MVRTSRIVEQPEEVPSLPHLFGVEVGEPRGEDVEEEEEEEEEEEGDIGDPSSLTGSGSGRQTRT